MKILIINLKSDTQRLNFQRRQMARLGLKFERLSATTAEQIPAAELANQAGQWERPMRETEVACLYSHRAAWKSVAHSNTPALILEDDALLSSKLPNILQALSLRQDLDHVTLEIRSRKKLLAKETLPLPPSGTLVRLYQDRTGAGAYVLWPRGAKILLQNSNRAAGLADAIIAAAYDMRSFQIEPAAAMQLDQCENYGVTSPLQTQTTIGTKSSQKPSAIGLSDEFKFKTRRIKSQLRMGLRQLTKITKARRRFVAVEIDDFQAHIS